MKKSVFILIVFCFGLSGFTTKVKHEFYVSVTDIYVDAQKAQINGVVKCFPDDWERAMNALLSHELKRYVQLDSAAQDSLHRIYLKKHINVKVGQQSIELNFSGTVTGPDEVYLLFEGPMKMPVEAYKEHWLVSHTLLADVYSSQENIVILHYRDQKYTSSCREGNNYQFNYSF
tara:strand:+ start:703 stop:1224 length:522 start_codon:yes stop_codon:yes gene_type:complete